MPVLYIAGDRPGCGKTALACALARLQAEGQGRPPILVKPFSRHPSDPDPSFYARLLPDGPPLSQWPRPLAGDGLPREEDLTALRGALAPLAHGPVIVEGLDGLDPASPGARASARLAEALDAGVVVVLSFRPGMDLGEVPGLASLFGPRLRGVVVNGVTRYQGYEVRTRLLPALRARGLPVLGAVPEDRTLLAPTVGDLAEHLGAQFLLLEERRDSLVEHIMVGGWFLDPGEYVFSRRGNKAVLVRGDRPDLQMAALQTSTVCLVLTEGKHPIQYVVYEAEQQEVPLLLVQSGTVEAMERLHSLPERVSVHHPRKAEAFARLLRSHCNGEGLSALLSALDRG